MRFICTGIFIAAMLSVCNLCSGQDNGTDFNLNFVPPSPNAASLGKFGDIPVSLYTGVPSITVPLFSYKGINNGLSLGVSLDYHAGGVRVEEIGSDVGIGWAVNAGGVISRTMRGLPDDLPSFGFMALYPETTPADTINNFPPWVPPGQNDLNTYINGGWDSEQDVFNYNFSGHSGRFLLDPHGTPILITKEDIIIKSIPSLSPGGGPIRGFSVTDQLGLKYIFLDAETTNANLGLVHPSYSSSWYLSAITNAFGTDSIKFSYNNSFQYYQTMNTEVRRNLYNGQNSVTASSSYVSTSGASYTVNAKIVKSISFPDKTEVDFKYAPVTRCDLHGDSILTQVLHVDKTNDSTIGFQLFQSYFDLLGHRTAYITPPCDTSLLSSTTNMRLRLDSLRQFSKAITLRPYVFQYDDRYLLPALNSMQQDFWGYANSTVDTATTLVPLIMWVDTVHNNDYMLDGTDRRSDSNMVKACSLNQITYPTGGNTQFKYSVNRAGDGILIFPQARDHFVSFGPNLDSGYTRFSVNRQPEAAKISFGFHQLTWCPGMSENCQLLYTITSDDDEMTIYASQVISFSQVGTTQTVPNVDIPNGNYKLNWSFTGGTAPDCSCDETFGFQLVWTDETIDSNQLAGGLRIDTVINYDGISHANDMLKIYRYVDTAGKPSGTTGVFPGIGYTFEDCTLGSINEVDGTTIYSITVNRYLTRLGTTSLPLTYTQGSAVGYSRVEVTAHGPQNNGKEADQFISYKEYPPYTATIPSIGDTMPDYPFIPWQTADWALGKLTKQELFDSTGRIVQRVVNNYSIQIDNTTLLDSINNYRIAMVTQDDCGSLGDFGTTVSTVPGFTTHYNIHNYHWKLGHTQKIYSSTTLYDPSGDSVRNATTYAFDPVYLDEVVQATSIDSKSDTVFSYYYYPFDYTISGSVFPAMVDSNMIGQPVSNETWKALSGKHWLTGANATNYSAFHSGYYPKDHYLFNSNQPVDPSVAGSFDPTKLLRVPSLYYEDVILQSYDTKGNLLEFNKLGSASSFIWDINQQLPIGQVVNADTGNIAYTSFEADGTGNWSIPDTNRVRSTSMTGSNAYAISTGKTISKAGLNSALTYVVSYWSTGGPLNVNGSADTAGVTVGSWTYYEHKVTGATTISITGTATIDELRLFPKGAMMTTYTYSPLMGMTSQCTPTNYITHYGYDGLGRLSNVKDLRGNVIKTLNYHYKGQ